MIMEKIKKVFMHFIKRHSSFVEISTTPYLYTRSIFRKNIPLLKFRIAKETDKETIVDFLRKKYFKCEPILRAFNYDSKINDWAALENYYLRDVKEEVSTIALNEKNEIMALGLVSPISKEQYIKSLKKDLSENYSHPLKPYMRLLDISLKNANLHEKIPNLTTFCHFKVLTTDTASDQAGVEDRLLMKLFELARAANIPYAVVVSTDSFMTFDLKTRGWELMYTIKYTNFLEKGKAIFRPGSPHLSVFVMAKSVNMQKFPLNDISPITLKSSL